MLFKILIRLIALASADSLCVLMALNRIQHRVLVNANLRYVLPAKNGITISVLVKQFPALSSAVRVRRFGAAVNVVVYVMCSKLALPRRFGRIVRAAAFAPPTSHVLRAKFLARRHAPANEWSINICWFSMISNSIDFEWSTAVWGENFQLSHTLLLSGCCSIWTVNYFERQINSLINCQDHWATSLHSRWCLTASTTVETNFESFLLE